MRRRLAKLEKMGACRGVAGGGSSLTLNAGRLIQLPSMDGLISELEDRAVCKRILWSSGLLVLLLHVGLLPYVGKLVYAARILPVLRRRRHNARAGVRQAITRPSRTARLPIPAIDYKLIVEPGDDVTIIDDDDMPEPVAYIQAY